MCNFVPGEVVAFGRRKFLEIPEIEEVGEATIVPIIPDDLTLEETEFREYSFLHLKGIREGCEVAVVSKLSAILSRQIQKKQAVVELNYTLPRAVASSKQSSRVPEFSLETKQWISHIRRHTRRSAVGNKRPVAVIDSGVNVDNLRTRRDIKTLGFRTVNSLDDNLNHGTLVARIINDILPEDVPLVCGKIGDQGQDVTVMRLSQLFAEIVATYEPSIVNLSLSPYADSVYCHKCRARVRVEAFHSYIFRHVLQLAPRTLTVMAAGNSSSYCNDELLDKSVNNIIYAVAIGTNGHITGYSSEPSGESSALYAFGGDDESLETGSGVLEESRDVFGTSFAAPLVSSALYSCVADMDGSVRIEDIVGDHRMFLRRVLNPHLLNGPRFFW
jgi:hypothetical protein